MPYIPMPMPIPLMNPIPPMPPMLPMPMPIPIPMPLPIRPGNRPWRRDEGPPPPGWFSREAVSTTCLSTSCWGMCHQMMKCSMFGGRTHIIENARGLCESGEVRSELNILVFLLET